MLSSPKYGENVDMRNELLEKLDRIWKRRYSGWDALLDAVYDQILVPKQVNKTNFRGYMLNFVDTEWDNMQVIIRLCSYCHI